MKPVVAIASNLEFYSERQKVSVNRAYSDALIAGGALPILLPVTLDTELIERAMSLCSGLLLPGGIDVWPRLYNAEPAPGLGHLNPELDRFQLLVICSAIKRAMPILGICRGEQLLNVALGGTLIQHLPSTDSTIQHCQDMDPRWPAHSVRCQPGSLVARALGENFDVNSFHHQAVDTPAPDMDVTSRAPDGIIEAIEHTKLPFVVGVQWHPEGMLARNDDMLPLFTTFVDHCRNYASE